MAEPREMTTEEVKERFLAHVRNMVIYWSQPGLDAKDLHERLSGLAFSILAAIDGSACGLPAFILAPAPHPDDREFHKAEGENWYPENHESSVKADIGGSLHEEFYK